MLEIFYKRRNYDAALEQLKAIQEMLPLGAGRVAWLGRIYSRLGMLREAQLDNQFVSSGFIAIVYANLDEKDLAFTWLERALVAYDSLIFNLNDPDWDPIRSDPRFVELCDRLGMACAKQ